MCSYVEQLNEILLNPSNNNIDDYYIGRFTGVMADVFTIKGSYLFTRAKVGPMMEGFKKG